MRLEGCLNAIKLTWPLAQEVTSSKNSDAGGWGHVNVEALITCCVHEWQLDMNSSGVGVKDGDRLLVDGVDDGASSFREVKLASCTSGHRTLRT